LERSDGPVLSVAKDLKGGKKVPMRYAGLGVQLAVSLLLFVWIGQWADRKFDTGGLLTVLAALLGFGGTMYWLIRSLGRKEDGKP
jgi:Putative F0F1-ATPase subunit Ca2+/Mg2+ transporter